MVKKNETIASVLAFEKKLVPSDGYLYGTNWQQRKVESTPLRLREKSVRGTISNRLKKALKDDPIKLDAEVEKPNLQTVDHCALGTNQDTLRLHFTLKILQGVECPSACNNSAFNETYRTASKKYIDQEGFKELSMRYATNIANGRFLWRNRVGAENIEIEVKAINADAAQSWTFDAYKTSVREFNSDNSDINGLADKIAEALSGKTPYLLLEINAFAQVGNAQDVYPSEEMVLDKGNSKNKKSKILYHIDGIAGMHSQKIGNAIRTIDTWYPTYEEITGPIAIEPYGAVTNLGKAYRTPKDNSDFFTLFDKFATGEELKNKEEAHYVMAVLVRGGVFGESGKE